MTGNFRLHPKLKGTARLKRCDWPECGAACCIYGAWVDKHHARDIMAHAREIIPYMETEHQDPHSWFDGQEEPDDHALSGIVIHTTILPNPYHFGGTSCIFLRKDHKCALQATADENGSHPWRYKPFYCILHPLDMDEEGRITMDEPELLLKEPTSCLQTSRQEIELRETFHRELEYLLSRQMRLPRD